MEDETKGPLVGYTWPNCEFDTDVTNCDACDAIVKWDDEVGGTAHCTGCGMEIIYMTCRECGERFSL